MLIREGDQRTAGINLGLAVGFSGIAGAVNAAAFQATGFFSANMTGNASSLSNHLALGEGGIALTFAAMLAMFILGAFCSGLLIELGRRRGSRAVYAYSIAAEGILLVGLGLVFLGHSQPHGSALSLGASFAMGLQNAATTRISNARIRTTHVSGMATDIGLGLAAFLIPGPGRPEAIARLQIYFGALIAFICGGVLGVLTYLRIGSVLFVAAGSPLLWIGLVEIKRARRAA